MINNMDFVIPLIGVLLSVAFFTIMERKLMGLMHYRKGPNKTLMSGVSQPMADAMKLLTKEMTKLNMTKMMMFYSGPLIMMILMLANWSWFEFSFQMLSGGVKMMIIFSIMSLTAYGFMAMSWGSNSKYSMLGGHRAIAQIISYEVCLFLFILSCSYAAHSFQPEALTHIQQGMWMALFSAPLFMVWVTLCLAESNRTPFDMAEGESEIVSGFNIEYGGGMFAIIFISEYGGILFLSYITANFFMGSGMILLKTFLLAMVFVWVRCSFPRIRYDKLMMISWKIALPYSVALLSLLIMM